MTLAQAKSRLRETAAGVERASTMEPGTAMLLALLAGLLVGSGPEARKTLAKVLVGTLFR